MSENFYYLTMPKHRSIQSPSASNNYSAGRKYYKARHGFQSWIFHRNRAKGLVIQDLHHYSLA